jgi:hypothetical protein
MPNHISVYTQLWVPDATEYGLPMPVPSKNICYQHDGCWHQACFICGQWRLKPNRPTEKGHENADNGSGEQVT